MALGCRLASAVPRPVDARQSQLQRCGIHSEDLALEPKDEARMLAVLGESRTDALQVVQHLPVQRLGHRRIARTVGVGERVASWRCRPPNPQELRLMHHQRVADVIQAQGVRDMPIEQREHVACRRKSPSVDLELPAELGNHVRRNLVANLPEHGMLTLRWPGRSALAGARRLAAPRFFFIRL